MHNIYKLCLLSLTLLITCSCASIVTSSERDQSGRFDGHWGGTVALEQVNQSYGHWEWTCQKFRARMSFNVTDGEIQLALGNGDKDRYQTYIDVNSRIYLRTTAASSPDTTLTIAGDLDAASGVGSGTLILGNRGGAYGCKSEWRVQKT